MDMPELTVDEGFNDPVALSGLMACWWMSRAMNLEVKLKVDPPRSAQRGKGAGYFPFLRVHGATRAAGKITTRCFRPAPLATALIYDV